MSERDPTGDGSGRLSLPEGVDDVYSFLLYVVELRAEVYHIGNDEVRSSFELHWPINVRNVAPPDGLVSFSSIVGGRLTDASMGIEESGRTVIRDTVPSASTNDGELYPDRFEMYADEIEGMFDEIYDRICDWGKVARESALSLPEKTRKKLLWFNIGSAVVFMTLFLMKLDRAEFDYEMMAYLGGVGANSALVSLFWPEED